MCIYGVNLTKLEFLFLFQKTWNSIAAWLKIESFIIRYVCFRHRCYSISHAALSADLQNPWGGGLCSQLLFGFQSSYGKPENCLLPEKSPWITAILLCKTLSEGIYGLTTSLTILLQYAECLNSYHHVLQYFVEACFETRWLRSFSRILLFRGKRHRLCLTDYSLIHLGAGGQVLHHCAAFFFFLFSDWPVRRREKKKLKKK